MESDRRMMSDEGSGRSCGRMQGMGEIGRARWREKEGERWEKEEG